MVALKLRCVKGRFTSVIARARHVLVPRVLIRFIRHRALYGKVKPIK
jgi:hypothetical protein